MWKLANAFGLFALLIILSACTGKTAEDQTPIKSTTNQGQITTKNETTSVTNEATNNASPATTSEMPKIKSTDPNINDLNNLADEITGLDQSAQDLNENQDLSAE